MTDVTLIKKWIDDYYGEERCFYDFETQRLPKTKIVEGREVYEKDKYGDVIYENREVPTLIIYYPEILVQSNVYKRKHLIKDSWLKFVDFYNKPEFTRTTVTMAEHTSRYFHSHAQRNQIGNWSGICTGGSTTPFAKAFIGFCEDVKLEQLTEENLWYYLNCFEEGFSTESSSTTPYIHMSKIVNRSKVYNWDNVFNVNNHTFQYIMACLDPKYNLSTDEYYYDLQEVDSLLQNIIDGKYKHNLKYSYSRNINTSISIYPKVDGVYYTQGVENTINTTSRMKILPNMVVDCTIENNQFSNAEFEEGVKPEYLMGILIKLNTKINEYYKQYKTDELSQSSAQLEG